MPRQRDSKPNAFLAAATRVNLRDARKAKTEMAAPQEWHAEAWTYYDEVPEIKESIRYRGHQLGKLRLFVAVPNPTNPEGNPVPASDPASGVPGNVAAAAEAELHRLRSAQGGQGELLRMLDMNFEVVGECYLVGYGARDEERDPLDPTKVTREAEPENWMIHSVDEVGTHGSGANARTFIRDKEGDTKGRDLDPEQDTIIRLYQRHPRWSKRADCAMRGLIGDCRILQVLSQQLLAHSYRALSAGILTVPNELSFGPALPTQPDADPTGDPLSAALDAVLSGPVEDPSSPSTVQPGLLRGPAEFLKPDYLRRIGFYDADVVKDIEAKIEARVKRIARGLNLPVEKVMGFQQTTYANAEQIDEDEFSDFLEPSATTSVDALTFAFLAPQLREGGVSEEWVDRMFIWYDPADLIAQPDAEEHAKDAWDRNAISDAALRRAFGFGDEDAPEPVELLQRVALRRGVFGQGLTVALLEMLGIPIEIDDDDEVPVEAQADMVAQIAVALSAAAPRPAMRAASRTTNDYGRRLTDIDRDLRSRLLVAANAAMSTALDRAANRLRTRTNGGPMRASLRNVDRRSWFAQLGPALVADALGDEDPLAGAWDGLRGEYMAWVAAAQADARTVAAEALSAPLRASAYLEDLEAQQAEDRDTSWEWFAASLTALATERLWNPDPSAPSIGEHDPTVNIPAGMVRQAMARAGGATGLVTGGTGAWVALTEGGTRPAGGIGTGDLIRGALRDGGAGIEGYVWEYGPAYRQQPFPDHLALDGQTFANFDDNSLSGGGWTGFGYWMPGDHDGCRCDARPVIIPPGELTASASPAVWSGWQPTPTPPTPAAPAPTAQDGALVALMQTLAASLATPAPAPQVHVDAPHIDVHPPAVHVEAARPPDVHVGGPQLTVNPPDIHVAAPPPPDVHVDAPVTVHPPSVNVAPPPPAAVVVHPPAVNVEAPVVNVAAPKLPPQPPPAAAKPRSRRVERDAKGNISRIVEE